jgi:hypothetical protein
VGKTVLTVLREFMLEHKDEVCDAGLRFMDDVRSIFNSGFDPQVTRNTLATSSPKARSLLEKLLEQISLECDK